MAQLPDNNRQFQIFGWTIQRNEPERLPNQQSSSYTTPDHDDGAITVAAGGAYGTYVDLDGSVRNEAELIARYRDMAMQAECDIAIEDIVNECIVKEENDPILELDMSDLEEIYPDNIIETIRGEFEHIKNLLEFEQYGYEIFRKWFVDGRIYYNAILDIEAPQEGIKELRWIDSRKIKKIREVEQQKVSAVTSTTISAPVNEYYIYNETGFSSSNNAPFNSSYYYQNPQSGIKLTVDSVININSGLTDKDNRMVLSYLHKAIKPMNQLRMLEDATVIYSLARAPERRVFKINVGKLPKIKAEQYMREVMAKYKNRLVYDAQSGAIRDDRRFMTMTEDFWIPVRDDGSGTEIDTLQGGQNLGEIGHVEYFRTKLYQALNVPVSRLESDSMFNLGRASEITRDELKFQKFVDRLRLRFGLLFFETLGKQLALKQIMPIEEFEQIKSRILLVWAKDNYHTELKESEIFNQRLATLTAMQPYLVATPEVAPIFSMEYVYKRVLKMTDEEIKEMQRQVQKELPMYMGLRAQNTPEEPSE